MQADNPSFTRLRRITLWDVAIYLGVFCATYIGARLGLYIFFDLHSSPALIWPPAAIALAAMFFVGWGAAVPVVLALFSAYVQAPMPFPVSLIVPLSYSIQAAAGAYILRRFRFDPALQQVNSALLLTFVALFTTVIAPTINTLTLASTHALQVSMLLNWLRSWSGSTTGILMFAPALFAWFANAKGPYYRRNLLEVAIALVLTFAATVFVFWTPYTSQVGVSVIFFLPVLYVWFILRMEPRWFAIAMFLSAVVAIPGSILNPHTTPLNIQLLADEVYLGFLSAIFLLFATLSQERRVAFRDIEEHNAELRVALEKISAEDKAKTEFIAILAHELRNPLAPIVSAHEWLLMQEQPQESLVALQSAQKHTMMIRHLLDDLLDSARISLRGFTLNKEVVPLSDIIEQSIESTANFLQSRGHRLFVVRPEREVLLVADPVRLKQILINLLTNAGKYTPPGGRIDLHAAVEGNEAVMRVSDTGIGIEPEVLPHLFEPFRRFGTATNLGTGLGIGLTLTKRLVELHGGAIAAMSEGPGKGSAFEVRLPMPQEVPSDLLRRPEQPEEDQEVRPARVLIIDDNEEGAIALKKLLVHFKHVVEIAHDGHAGLVKALDEPAPDVILLDIGLPDIDGYEVAKRLRAQGYEGPIAAVTGYGQKSDKEHAHDAGFDFHLVKPVSVSDVIAILAKVQREERSVAG